MRRFPAAGARCFATLNHFELHSLDSHLVADPVLAGLPAAAVLWRKTRLAELMGQEPCRAHGAAAGDPALAPAATRTVAPP